MTNKEIMQSSLLDILFENRNKDYGAYTLRKEYNKRLVTALGSAMLLTALFILIFMQGKKNTAPVTHLPVPGIELKTIELPKEKIKETVEPVKKTVAKQKPAQPLAQVKYTSTITIKEDSKVKNMVPSVDDLTGKRTGTENTKGEPDDGKQKETTKVDDPGNGDDTGGPAKPQEPDFVIQEKDPEFPGGAEGLKKFLAKNLGTPGELEAGEKRMVKVKFIVDKDGIVNSCEIMASAGGEFDKEVLRVCKRMPRWIPAIQNGHNVPVSYVLPVTFVGMEQ